MSQDIRDFIESEFYYLHAHPELSFKEFETTKRIIEDLLLHDIRVLESGLTTGVIAEIGSRGPVVALRADIDALPVQEETILSYKSENEGIMHACGHDSHTAILLGAALILKKVENELPGKVRLIFQPAEEAPGGASEVIDKGGLDEVEAIFGLHCSPLYDVGTLALKEGPTHAAVEKFKVWFKGCGTHAAHPDLGNDIIVITSYFINAVQSLVSREQDPVDPAVVSITRIDAGTTWNVLPESSSLEGTIRTYSKSAREKIKRRFEEVAHGIASTFGVRAEVSFPVEAPATYNDPGLLKLARKVGAQQGFKLEEAPLSLGGEDFSLYQEKVKGFFSLLGTGHSYPNHNPRFRVDVRALYPAALYQAALAREYLEGKYE